MHPAKKSTIRRDAYMWMIPIPRRVWLYEVRYIQPLGKRWIIPVMTIPAPIPIAASRRTGLLSVIFHLQSVVSY